MFGADKGPFIELMTILPTIRQQNTKLWLLILNATQKSVAKSRPGTTELSFFFFCVCDNNRGLNPKSYSAPAVLPAS